MGCAPSAFEDDYGPGTGVVPGHPLDPSTHKPRPGSHQQQRGGPGPFASAGSLSSKRDASPSQDSAFGAHPGADWRSGSGSSRSLPSADAILTVDSVDRRPSICLDRLSMDPAASGECFGPGDDASCAISKPIKAFAGAVWPPRGPSEELTGEDLEVFRRARRPSNGSVGSRHSMDNMPTMVPVMLPSRRPPAGAAGLPPRQRRLSDLAAGSPDSGANNARFMSAPAAVLPPLQHGGLYGTPPACMDPAAGSLQLPGRFPGGAGGYYADNGHPAAANHPAAAHHGGAAKLRERRGCSSPGLTRLQSQLSTHARLMRAVGTRAAGLKHIGFSCFKKENQDEFFIQVGNLGGEFGGNLFCVFDGHGAFGKAAAAYSRQMLPGLLDAELRGYFGRNPGAAAPAAAAATRGAVGVILDEVFGETERALSRSGLNLSSSGTTASVAYQLGNRLWVAAAGDSRALLCRRDPRRPGAWRPQPLSLDHRPRRRSERERVEGAGALVGPRVLPCGQAVGEPRMWCRDGPGGGAGSAGLLVSRSLGDLMAASVGCTSDPEVTYTTLEPGVDRYLVLASDGVWDVLSNEQVCDIVTEAPDPHTACRRVLDAALYEWEERMSADNITVLVAELDWAHVIAAEGEQAANRVNGAIATASAKPSVAGQHPHGVATGLSRSAPLYGADDRNNGAGGGGPSGLLPPPQQSGSRCSEHSCSESYLPAIREARPLSFADEF